MTLFRGQPANMTFAPGSTYRISAAVVSSIRPTSVEPTRFSTLEDYLSARPYSLVQQQGDGRVVFIEVVAGGFFQDEYRLRPKLTVSAGVRYDWQNFIHDSNNFSPRASFA